MVPDRDSFWFGSDATDRRHTYAAEYRQRAGQLEANANDTMSRYEGVCMAYAIATGKSGPRRYASGWRPRGVNDKTKNSAMFSAHLDAHAGDGEDDIDGSFAWWCFDHHEVLEVNGVFMEHPTATVVRSWVNAHAKDETPHPWCHLSPVPPKSGNRIYFPDVVSLSEWQAFVAAGGKAGMTHADWLLLQKD